MRLFRVLAPLAALAVAGSAAAAPPRTMYAPAASAAHDFPCFSAANSPQMTDCGFQGYYYGGTTGGSGNAQTLATTHPNGFALTAGMLVGVQAGFSNSGAATLAIAGGSALPMRLNTGSGLAALSGGEVVAGNRYVFALDTSSSFWVLTNPSVIPGAGTVTSIIAGTGLAGGTITTTGTLSAAQMGAHTFKGNNTGSTTDAIDLTATQLTAELNAMVGDSGSGGTKGLAPAPGAGDAAAGKFLNAGGTYSVPAGTSSGTVTSVSLSAPLGGGTVSTSGTLGTTSYTAHGVLMGESTSALAVSAAGTAGQAFLSGGASADGAYGALDISTAAVTGTLPAAKVPANIRVRSFGTTFGDTAGSALTSGSVVYFTIPYACTISAWNITVDAGTVTFDIWKIATGTAIPTVSNTITASALPALSTGTALHSTTLTSWTTSVTANDIIGIQLKTVATAKYAELDVECDQ
ncbi:MAG: hypothetical protein V4466_11605 [Pseudomonadota bacterium]